MFNLKVFLATLILAAAPDAFATTVRDLPTGTVTFSNTTTPSTPASGKLRVYTKSDGKVYKLDSTGTEREVGSGAGGGLNFATLDSSFGITKTTNADLEQTVGDWLAYADAAGTAIVDATGGSPTTTCTRTTTAAEVENGVGSLKITKPASNTQGEGCSLLVNIPKGYRGKRIAVTMPFILISGSWTEDDFRTDAYDVTNAVRVAPFRIGKLVGSQGSVLALIDTQTTTAQMRIAIHTASTGTSAVTFSVDDIVVGLTPVAYGPRASDAISTTLTGSAGLGTVANQATWMSAHGDRALFTGQMQVGTSAAIAATDAYFTLPTGISIDTSKMGTGKRAIPGIFHRLRSGAAGADSDMIFVFFDPASPTRVYLGGSTTASGEFEVKTGANIFSNNDYVTYWFDVPVTGWTTNVQMSESSQFKISTYLASGSRVTGSAPTALGQYRSYLRNANLTTYTETNGSPTASPSTADGMRIYNGNVFTSADSANEPTRYDIFIGKKKNWKIEFYGTTANGGQVDCSPLTVSASDYGYYKQYDPSTGILTIVANRNNGGGFTHNSCVNADGQNITQDPYFDIVVSENALMVGSEEPVIARYTSTNSQTFTNTVAINFTTKDFDTKGAYSSGTFTCPDNGYYEVEVNLETTANMGGGTDPRLYKNGSLHSVMGPTGAEPAGSNVKFFGKSDAQCNSGETLDVRMVGNSGTLVATAGMNWVVFKKLARTQ